VIDLRHDPCTGPRPERGGLAAINQWAEQDDLWRGQSVVGRMK